MVRAGISSRKLWEKHRHPDYGSCQEICKIFLRFSRTMQYLSAKQSSLSGSLGEANGCSRNGTRIKRQWATFQGCPLMQSFGTEFIRLFRLFGLWILFRIPTGHFGPELLPGGELGITCLSCLNAKPYDNVRLSGYIDALEQLLGLNSVYFQTHVLG
jgi:hypothetical protein